MAECPHCHGEIPDEPEQQQELPPPRIAGWQRLYQPNARAICIKDDPPMYGFGRQIKTGDTVDVDSVCWRGKYQISVKAECAFYDLEDYFEVLF